MSENAREIGRPASAGRGDRRMPGARVRPRLGVLDLLLYLWRSRLLIFLIFFAFVLAGLAITRLFPAQAVATARVLVSTPPEVSMTAGADRSARIVIRPNDALLEVERQVAMSPEFVTEAIARLGAERLYPDPFGLEQAGLDEATLNAERRFLAALTIEHERGSSALEFRFAHPNGTLAVEALDAFTSAYLSSRNATQPSDARPSETTPDAPVETRLARVNDAILAFLDANSVGDLTSEIETANATLAAISSAQVEVQASLGEAKGRARELTEEMQGAAAEIELFVETVSTDRVSALASERAQMLARFGPDHPVIEELDTQIAQARQSPPVSLESGRRRTGPNPVFQRLSGERSNARAQIAALEQRASALSAQRAQAEARRRALAALEPEWRSLVRMRDALENEIRRQAEHAGAPDLPQTDADAAEAVSLLEPPRLAGAGVSPAHGLLAIFAGLGLACALASGLIRGWLARGLPTAAATERTLGLRVLATAGGR